MIVTLETNTKGKAKTIIYVRGYDRDFEIEIYRKEPITIEYAEWYARTQIIETAIVKEIKHIMSEEE